DSIKKGDVVVVLEAMKMENDITAPADCTISSVNVNQGASVSTGDILSAKCCL
ncbi:MAG: acetyl-CoA carboxylase biotin carboxyl carrier protein subunit, partial [Alistipes sp.]|nr:acetyl-CoA carboxylase biotin carboxyl carrier protein subunit [Alistipes sp.]